MPLLTPTRPRARRRRAAVGGILPASAAELSALAAKVQGARDAIQTCVNECASLDPTLSTKWIAQTFSVNAWLASTAAYVRPDPLGLPVWIVLPIDQMMSAGQTLLERIELFRARLLKVGCQNVPPSFLPAAPAGGGTTSPGPWWWPFGGGGGGGGGGLSGALDDLVIVAVIVGAIYLLPSNKR